jgi:RecA/RadA recombinase
MSPPDQPDSLQAALAAIRQRFGSEALSRTQLTRRSTSPVATGLAELDSLLEGGIPTGWITEIVGRMGSGKQSLALHILAGGQKDERLGVYVDLNRSFDPASARHKGVNLDLLLVVRSVSAAIGMEIVEVLVRQQVARVAVVDLTGSSNIPDLRRLDRLLKESASAVVLLRESERGLCPQASLRLLVEWQRWLKRDGDLQGYESQVTVVKNKSGPVGQSALIRLTYDEWVDGAVA